MKPDDTPIGRILRAIDRAVGEATDAPGTTMSNRGLERITGISQSEIGRWRRGRTPKGVEVVERFASAIGLRPEHVMGGLEPPPGWITGGLLEALVREHKPRGRPSGTGKEKAVPAQAAAAALERALTRLPAAADALERVEGMLAALEHLPAATVSLERFEGALARLGDAAAQLPQAGSEEEEGASSVSKNVLLEQLAKVAAELGKLSDLSAELAAQRERAEIVAAEAAAERRDLLLRVQRIEQGLSQAPARRKRAT